MSTLLRCRGLHVSYPAAGSADREVLAGIDLDVGRGETLSLIGPSGCGKTTFLKVAAGLLRPTRGTLDVATEQVATVFQRPHLLPWRTVLDNAAYGLECRGERRTVARGRAAAMLAAVGLSDVASERPHALSEGMKQRVNLARALLVQPELLLMDEPFAAVDGLTRRRLQRELETVLADRDCGVVLVSHSIEEVATLSDRVVVLSDKPTVVRGVIEVDVPRPRDAHPQETAELRARLDRLTTGA